MKDMNGYNFSIHKEEDNNKMTSYTYGWTGKKGRDDLKGLIYREKVQIRGTMGHLCQKRVAIYQ